MVVVGELLGEVDRVVRLDGRLDPQTGQQSEQVGPEFRADRRRREHQVLGLYGPVAADVAAQERADHIVGPVEHRLRNALAVRVTAGIEHRVE
jgi:hypothetical protein